MDAHEPAFPILVKLGEPLNYAHSSKGMSYRDWLIGHCATGYLANSTVALEDTGIIVAASDIVEMADQIIKQK